MENRRWRGSRGTGERISCSGGRAVRVLQGPILLTQGPPVRHGGCVAGWETLRVAAGVAWSLAVGGASMSTRTVSKSNRKWVFLALAVAGLVAAYALFGFYGVPRIVRHQVLGFVAESYGRQAELGPVRFNPFTFVLEARDFSMPDADRERMLAFDRLHLDLEPASAWRLAPSFTAIELDRPYIRTLVRPDGSLNLEDLAKPFPADSEEEEPARLFVDRFVVRGGEIAFEDRSRPSPFRAHLRPVSFDLRDFSTTGQTGNVYALRGSSTRGERFAWDGRFAVNPLAARGRFEVTDLEARTIASYLEDSLDFELSNGRVALTGDYDFAAVDPVSLIVNVQKISVAGLGIRPRGGDLDYVQDASVDLGGVRLDLARERVDVGSLRLTAGTVRAWRDPQGKINLTELLPPDSAETPPERKAPPRTASTTETRRSAAAAAAASREAMATASATPASAAKTASTSVAAPAAASGVAPTPNPALIPTRQASAPQADEPNESESEWLVSVPDIAVENLRVEVEDRFVKPAAKFVLAPITARVKGYSTAPGVELDADAKLRINESADVSARAKVSPEAGTVAAHVDVKSLNLPSLQPYLNTYTQVSVLSGSLTTGLDVERNAKGVLTVKGDSDVEKLRLIDNALKQDMLKWDHLRVAGIDYVSEPARLRISNIAARAPYARVIIAPDQTLNLTKALSPAPGSSPAAVQTVETSTGETKAPGGNPGEMQISIGTVRVTDGSANFADFWIQPNYAVSIQNMNGTVNGLSSDAKSRAKVKLEGKVDRYAPANIEGEMNLLSAALFTDMRVSFKGVEMTSVTPYSGRFAGYKIEKGKLSIDVAYKIDNRALSAEQKFVIDQLQLGERVESPDAVRLPLKLAVALLKDRNGVIDLDLPISGSLDDPEFRIGPIIWKAVVNLLTKVATAPFALLGNLFGGGEEMNLIEFAPGESTLDPVAQERLASMVKALQERPQLQLDIPVAWSPEVDAEPLAARKMDERLQSLASEQNGGDTPSTNARETRGTGPRAEEGGARQVSTRGEQRSDNGDTKASVADDPAKRFDLLLAQYRADFGAEAPPPPATAALLDLPKRKRDPAAYTAANAELEKVIREKVTVSESEFQELAQARARAIQDALLGSGEIDNTRVFLLAASPTKPTGGKVQLALSLK